MAAGMEASAFFDGSKKANADLSAATNLYTVMKQTSQSIFGKQVSAGGVALGILQDQPGSSQAGKIAVLGRSKGRVNSTAHAAIAVGDKLVASTAAGLLPSTVVTHYVLARAMEALSSNSTGIIEVLITHQGAGSSGAAAAA